jgi:NADH-quinone oxidoreductase subunit E
MADVLPTSIDLDELRARWGGFAFTTENEAQAKVIIGRYPPGRQQSAIIPLLDMAQRQVGAETETQGWLPVPVIEYVAAYLNMPYMRAYEVATFYTMFNLRPVGRYHVQVCGTTPCMLRGSDDVLAACYAKGMKKAEPPPTACSRSPRSNASAPAPTRRWSRSTMTIMRI